MFGISTDNVETQNKFIVKENLEIPLLADPDKKLATQLGAIGALGYAKRFTYVIDKQGKIAKVFTKVSPPTHAEEVLSFIEKDLK